MFGARGGSEQWGAGPWGVPGAVGFWVFNVAGMQVGSIPPARSPRRNFLMLLRQVEVRSWVMATDVTTPVSFLLHFRVPKATDGL